MSSGDEVRPRAPNCANLTTMQRTLAWSFALLVATAIAGLPADAAACKPPQFIGERVQFELVAARRGGEPIPLDALPKKLETHATPYDHMRVEPIGSLKLVQATRPLPKSIERYNRRQRRIGTPICAVLVYREPSTPGRYTYELDPGEADPPSDARWLDLWPVDVPGVVELSPRRDRLTVTVDRPGDRLEIEYRFVDARFSTCAVADDRFSAVLAVLALALRRRRRPGSR